jgi:glycogen synthase
MKKILLVSVLKPVNDVRMYEKLAWSLAQHPLAAVHVAGQAVKDVPVDLKIRLHPLFSFSRSSAKRFLASFKLYHFLVRLKPQAIIVCSPELLIVSLIYKILFGAELYYDIQENYALNIRYTTTYPRLLRWPLSWAVRLLERFFIVYAKGVVLAEDIYTNQLRLVGNRKTIILKNYAKESTFTKQKGGFSKTLVLLYSGTISKHYGVIEAICFAKNWHSYNPNVSLTIIGYCQEPSTWADIQALTASIDYITIIGGTELVPHDLILKEINKADIGLLPYQENKATKGRAPTKFYEYANANLLMLAAAGLVYPNYSRLLSIDFANLDARALELMLNNLASLPSPDLDEYRWGQRQTDLLNSLVLGS